MTAAASAANAVILPSTTRSCRIGVEALDACELNVDADGNNEFVLVLSERSNEVLTGGIFSSAAVVTVLDGLGRLGGVTIDPGAGDVVPGVEHAPGMKQPALLIVTRVFDVKVDASIAVNT